MTYQPWVDLACCEACQAPIRPLPFAEFCRECAYENRECDYCGEHHNPTDHLYPLQGCPAS